MSSPIGPAQLGSVFFDTQKSIDSDAQKPKVTIGHKVGSEWDMPKRPAVLGETDVATPPTGKEARPADDKRSAMEIFYDNPILETGLLWREWNQDPQVQERRAKLIENLKQQVGDFTSANKDPDSRAEAMYRLAHVVNYIDSDKSLSRNGNSPGNEHLDTNGSMTDVSEEARLIEFSEKGYSALQSQPKESVVLEGRVSGDHRTVEEITANPLFEGLGGLLGIGGMNAFKKHVGGDWEDPSLPAGRRADIAANAERVLQNIDSKGGEESSTNNGKIDGYVDAPSYLPRPAKSSRFVPVRGSEADRLEAFLYRGVSSLSK